jgi:hypothetical protein
MIVDDRAQESLGKELSAFREGRLLPLDSWLVTRVVFESGALRAGVEKLDGAWRSAGRDIEGRIADDLLDRLSRAEVRRFVPVKELASIGLATVRKKKPVPAGTVEVLLEKAKEPVRLEFFAPPELAPGKLVAVQVSSRGDTIVVDSQVWDDVRSLASRLKTAPAALAPAAQAPGPGTGAVSRHARGFSPGCLAGPCGGRVATERSRSEPTSRAAPPGLSLELLLSSDLVDLLLRRVEEGARGQNEPQVELSGELRPLALRPDEARTAELGLGEVGVRDVGPLEESPFEDRADEVGEAEVGPGEVRFLAFGADEVRPREIRGGRHDPGHARPLHVRPAERGAVEVGALEDAPFEVRLGQVGTGEVGLGVVAPPEVRADADGVGQLAR